MTILWDRDSAAGGRLNIVLGDEAIRVESAAALIRALSADAQEDVVVVGPDIELDAACELTERLRVEHAAMGVILLRRRLDVHVMAQALRAGAREVVATDDLPALGDAIRRSRELSFKLRGIGPGATSKVGKIVTVFSAKGGVGKTTISTNIGAYLASRGQRTLLVDLDLDFGDVGISLQLLPQRSMADLINMAGHLDEQGLASVVTKHSSGLDTICAPAEPGEADRITATLVAELLRVARQVYEFVVIDTPPALTEHVLTAFDVSDVLLLVATLDLPALKNLRLTLDTLDLLGSPREARHVLLNRSDSNVGLRAEDVMPTIKQEIAAMVPSSRDVPASINRGVALVLDDPRHPVSIVLRQLADRYLREVQPEAVSASTGTPRRLLSWGGRR
ncbi:MAG: AAA family ATPase [Candidatus Phosphoribacter sp.]